MKNTVLTLSPRRIKTLILDKNSYIGPLKDVNDKLHEKDDKKSNIMNSFFANVGKELALALGDCEGEMIEHFHRVTPTCSEINIDFELFTNSFKKAIKVGKAAGADLISAKDLKINESASSIGLFQVLRKCIENCKYPTEWKTAKVCSVYKNKGSKKDCSNYRPISLLSLPSKVFEHYICLQIKDHLNLHNLQNDHQWGFREKRSAEDLLLHLTETWRRAIDQNKVVGVLFIDLKKAFDSISHDVLDQKLKAAGLSGDMYNFIQSYLSERSQFTVINGTSSSTSPVEYGVPQGSLIGPVAFTINVEDMPSSTNSHLELLADDSTLFEIGDSVDNVIVSLQREIQNFNRYATKNSLTIHPDKCKILIMSRVRMIGPLPPVTLNGTTIEIVKQTKCLGLIIDDDLTWSAHVDWICKRFYSKLKKLYRMRSLSPSTLETIYNQGILPSVLYGIIIWGNCAPNIMSNVEKTHLRAARYIKRIKKRIPDHEVLSKAKWRSISHYYKRRIACCAYKIYKEQCSPLLFGLIDKCVSKKKNRNNWRINVPSSKYVDYKRSFRIRVVTIWNNLSTELKACDSYDSFKEALKKSDILDRINFGAIGVARDLDFIYY